MGLVSQEPTLFATTIFENIALGQNLGDFHSGFRAYSRAVLETVPWKENSDDFVFDTQFLAQAVYFGFRLGDIPVPVRYFAEGFLGVSDEPMECTKIVPRFEPFTSPFPIRVLLENLCGHELCNDHRLVLDRLRRNGGSRAAGYEERRK